MTTEQEFFRNEEVLVTRSRIVIGLQTYPMNGITAIRTETVPPKRLGAVVLGVFGVVFTLNGFGGEINSFLIGLLLLGLAVAWWKGAKPVYNIFFGTAGGEKQALSNPDAEYVDRVSQAVNEALIARA